MNDNKVGCECCGASHSDVTSTKTWAGSGGTA